MKIKILLILLWFLPLEINCKWEQCSNGIYGGNIYGLFSNGKEIFASPEGGGIYSTSVDTIHWSLIDLPLNVSIIGLKGDTLLATYYEYGTEYYGIYYSIKEYDSWNMIVGKGLKNRELYSTFNIKNCVFAATDTGIYVLKNENVEWEYASKGLNTPFFYCFVAMGDNIFIGDLNSGSIFSSSDLGKMWFQVKTNIQLPGITTFFEYNGKLLAGTQEGIYISNDSAKTWTKVGNGAPTHYITSFTKNNYGIFVYSEYSGVYVSSDSAKSWTSANKGLNGFVRRFLANKDMILAGTDKYGIYFSNDNGQNWQESNYGLTNTFGGYSENKSILTFSTAYSGLYFSNDEGNSWNNIIGNLKYTEVLFMRLINNTIFASAGRKGFYKNENYGNDWTPLNINPDGFYVSQLLYHNDKIYIAGSTVKGMGNPEIYVSTDKGSTWIEKNNELKNHSVLFLGEKDSILFVISDDRKLYRSANDGDNWIQISDLYDNNYDINMLLLDFDYFYLCTSKGLKVSYNLGIDWLPLNNELSGLEIRSMRRKDNLFFVATNKGVYLSSDTCKSWKPINDGLKFSAMGNIHIFGNYIFCSTNFGAFRAKLSDFGISNVSDHSFSISQISCSPNPATDFLEISVGANGIRPEQNIEIFSVLGEKILTTAIPDNLTPDPSPNRRGEVRIDVSGLSPGIYFLKVGAQVGKFVKI